MTPSPPSRGNRTPGRIRLLLAIGAALLAAGPGCDDPVELCEPPVSATVVTGRVLSGGLAVDGHIRARETGGSTDTRAEFLAVPDESGSFALDLPAGRYVFRLDLAEGHYDFTGAGPSFGQTAPDTIEVGAGIPVPEIEFVLGGLRLGLDVPADLHGQFGEVTLHPAGGEPREPGSRVTRGAAEIVAGRFEVEVAGILPGDYRVEMDLGCTSPWCGFDSRGERFWLPFTHEASASELFRVAPDSLLEITGVIGGEPARIEGCISGAWLDMGITNDPLVSVVTEDSLQTLSSFFVDEDGCYSAEFLVPGRVKVLVSQSGIDYWIGGPGFAGAAVFDLEPGRTITGVDHDQCGLHLVVDEASLPLVNGKIQIYNRADMTLAAEWSRGDYGLHRAIPNLWPGEYVLYFDHYFWPLGGADWRPQWFDRAAAVEQAQTVRLATAGQVVRLNVVLEMGGRISGRFDDGETPNSFLACLYPADGDAPVAERYFWEPDFTMTGLPDGLFHLGAVPLTSGQADGDIIWHPGTRDRSEARTIEIKDASVVAGADIILPR